MHALGSMSYSMGDVLLTNILTRLNVSPAFLRDHLTERPQLQEYYNLVTNRPSYIKANMNFPAVPNNSIVTYLLFIIVYFVSIFIWAFYKSYTPETYLCIAGTLLIFTYSVIILLGCIGKCRLSTYYK